MKHSLLSRRAGEAPVLDTTKLWIASCQDEAFQQELIEAFLRSISEAEEAITAAARGSGTLEDVAWHAHRLKGTGLTLGAEALSVVCAELEKAAAALDGERSTVLMSALLGETAKLRSAFASLHMQAAA